MQEVFEGDERLNLFVQRFKREFRNEMQVDEPKDYSYYYASASTSKAATTNDIHSPVGFIESVHEESNNNKSDFPEADKIYYEALEKKKQQQAAKDEAERKRKADAEDKKKKQEDAKKIKAQRGQ